MTILFFARLFWPHGGGVETHVREIGKRLVAMGYKVTVVAESHNTLYHSNSESARMAGEIDGIRIVRFDVGKEGFWKKFRVWLWLWRHRQLILSADIVHSHDVFFWYLPFRFLYLTKPVYTTFHGYETKFPPSKKAILWRKLSEKLSWGNICVGDYIKKWYGTRADFVTYGGANVHLGGVMASQAWPATIRGGKNNSKLKILFIGRLEEDIGIETYLQALERLRKEKVKFEITFLGDGTFANQASEYGKVVTNHSNDSNHSRVSQLSLRGAKRRGNLMKDSHARSLTSLGMTEVRNAYHYSELLHKADVIFSSSYLSMLLAMAAKKPVVAVYANSLKKDYLTMTPFAKYITIVDSADKIVAEVKNLEKTKEKGDQAYNWVKTQTWEKVTNVYLELWKVAPYVKVRP